MSENLNITFRIEGTAQENGHVTLSDFLAQMELFLRTLKRFDAIVDDAGKTRVYYRIVNASHNSPLTIELEPVPLEVRGRPATHDRIKEGHDRYFSELHRIQKGDAPSADVDHSTLEILKSLAFPKAKSIGSQVIHNSGKDVVLNDTFKANLSKLLETAVFSVGSITGKLDALNFHDDSRKRFWIYPAVGPRRVECTFLPGEQEKVRKLVGKHVTVYGAKHFRPNSPHPHLIAVRDFWEAPATDRSGLMAEIRRVRALPANSAAAGPEVTFAHEW